MKSMIKKRKKIWLLLIALLIFTCFALYNGIVVRHYELSCHKLDGSIRIVLITDLHSHIYGNHQQDLIDIVEKQKPDLLLLVGDIADNIVPIQGTELFLEGVKDFCPVYYTTGNHEFWAPDVNEILRTFRSYGVTVLEGQYHNISINETPLIICGVDDPDKWLWDVPSEMLHHTMRKTMLEAFSPIADATEYKILLAHRPELIELYNEFPFDLIVSGHAHGGQVRIPLLLNGLYAPGQGFFPDYAGGVYTHGDVSHVVSRGLAMKPRLPRVFNPPEVVVIDIHKR